MSTPTRPTDQLPWATATPGNIVRPSDTVINTGYTPSQKPASANFNYIVNLLWNYIDWFDFNIGAGIGGGGSALSWIESEKLAPFPMVENRVQVYGYDAGAGQALVAVLEVPSGYNVGSPIKIFNRVYSPDSTGSLQFQTVSTLIRSGVDAMTSTTNQHTSTNSAITLSSSTVNVPQAVIYDVSDSSGMINGVAVNPGDIIIIELQRGTDTAVSKGRCITFASIPTFS